MDFVKPPEDKKIVKESGNSMPKTTPVNGT